jgi:hypothetical protein
MILAFSKVKISAALIVDQEAHTGEGDVVIKSIV